MDADACMRRTLDVVLATVLLVALAPVLLVAAALVRLGAGRPVLFVQERVGRNGRPFGLLKFRTMVADAARRGPALTAKDDPRVTRVGAVLRRWKLDELPQLWNVVRGDMSLVGPRPELPRYVAHYSPAARTVLRVRPGITDPASLEYADETSVLARYPDPERAYLEVVLPHKITLSRAYLAHRSVASDLGILARTFVRVLRPGVPGPAAPSFMGRSMTKEEGK
jgi:lipopolysaccharide/colanic/teichoic acid biosynthesis glycosyltransferase